MAQDFENGHKINVQNRIPQRRIVNAIYQNTDCYHNAVNFENYEKVCYHTLKSIYYHGTYLESFM